MEGAAEKYRMVLINLGCELEEGIAFMTLCST